jgi:flagellar hook-associated protein 1 FlgK
MSSDLTQALRSAHSGLIANQQALDVIARNVSNASTPGYSRKIVNLEQRTLAGLGAGVQSGAVTRHVDQGLTANLRIESGHRQASAAAGSLLARVQDLFGTPESNGSLAHQLAEMQAAVEALAVAPQDSLSQRQMVSAGEDLAYALRHASTSLQKLRLEADKLIGERVHEINGLLQAVSELNDKIVRNRAVGQGAADLEDTRDLKLDRLAELIDIRVADRGAGGDIVVFTASGRTLVDGTAVTLTHSSASSIDAAADHGSGFIDGIYIGDKLPGNDITNELRSGEVAGLIGVRDRSLPGIQSALDELAVRLRDEVNAVHNQGVAFPGLSTMTGSRSFSNTAAPTITFNGTTDTALVLFDAKGNELAQTTVRTLLDDPAATGSPLSTGDATATIDELRTALNGALGGALSAKIIDGKLVLSVTTAGATLALRDQVSSARGAAADNAAIAFNADGVGGADEQHQGFSAFFGLNDFFLDAVGADSGRIGVSATLQVRADIAAAPDRVARGAVQWDAGVVPSGRYVVTAGDDTVIQRLTATLASGTDLAAAGRLPATTATLAEYAATLIGDASVQAASANEDASFRSDLVEALKQKSDSVRGVNLDEELSDLMLYEQGYAAAARVVQVIKELFETLDRALG